MSRPLLTLLLLGLVAYTALGSTMKDLRNKAEASKMKDMADIHHERIKNSVVEPATVAATVSAAGIKAAASHAGANAATHAARAMDPAEIRKKLAVELGDMKPLDGLRLPRVDQLVNEEGPDHSENARRAAEESFAATMDFNDINKRREMIEELRRKAAEARERAGADRRKWLDEVKRMMDNVKKPENMKDEL
eukprot:TRINITY_DN11005_c0_g1_i1.p1 TRINITY_DN11005_c0_g1~~TRINITY_DN11005_c0_g1_i1.p1  ORF type:complete len:193 (-),score=48.40 TRINITY_DN11005_c0_g1_i1:10-588(-)